MATSTLTLTLALDFLSVEGVVEAKLVSKAARSAARTVLTRGRYQPVALWLALTQRLRALTDSYYHFTEQEKHLLRAAWSLEPAIVAAEGILIPRKRTINSEIFEILAPSLDGLERLVAAWEHVSIGHSFAFYAVFNCWIVRRAISPVIDNNEDPSPTRSSAIIREALLRFWRAVERWSDLEHTVKAVYPWCAAVARDGHDAVREASVMTAEHWTDQAKINSVVTGIRAGIRRLESEWLEFEHSRRPLPVALVSLAARA